MQRYRTYVAEELYAGPGHPGPALLEMSRLSADVADLREHVDVCVVLVHWGRNYRGVTALQRRLAGEMRAAGADLVIGHHPHIPQPVDVVDGVPVFYSLGNAAFSTVGRFDGRHPPYGLIAVVEMDRRGVTGLDLKLIKVDNTVVEYQPRPADSPTDLAYLETLRP
jgi:poly-gamma-glutamate synthesis protein (capsule biosynthesis protein)